MVRIKPPAKRLTQTERLQRSWNDASLNLHIEEVGDLREELELNQKPTKKQRKSAVIKDSLTPTLPVFLSGKLPEGSNICLVKFSIEIADGNDSESVEKVFEAAISGALSDAALILPESPLSAGHLMLFTTNNSGETSLLHCLSAFDSKNLFDALRQNKAWVVGMGEIDSARLQLNFNVSIRPSGFVTLNFPAEILGSRMNFNFQSLLDLFSSQISSSIGQIYSPHKTCRRESFKHQGEVDLFYSAYKIAKKEIIAALTNQGSISHPSLRPTLRPYQKLAVSFMLSRENLTQKHEASLHPLYREITTIDGTVLYYNCVSDCRAFVKEKPLKPPIPAGGFLCDEMGLGKTVEVLTTVLLNPKPKSRAEVMMERNERKLFDSLVVCCFCGSNPNEKPLIQCQKCLKCQHVSCVNWDDNWDFAEYFCPHCVVLEEPFAGGATLIISPESICDQWHSEIQKHIDSDSIKVYIYKGVDAGNYAQPRFLADQDLVLCTYETLRKELNFVDLPHSDRLRKPKRFMTTPSPLTAVNWWRICLDEAQLVEGSSAAAEMCLKLSAEIRWCVTGTPMSKSVNDLYGLCLFVGIDPFFMRKWWDQLLIEPFTKGDSRPLISAISPYFWRTEKSEVVTELHLPDQTSVEYWLDFSPVEAHFYSRIVDKCRDAATKVLSKWQDTNIKLSDIHPHEIDAILRPMLKLRQACCHPQIVRGQFIKIQKSVITMNEVLESMIKKTSIECEEEQRTVTASLNGLAGLDIVENHQAEAAAKYREVLLSHRDKKEKVRTDPLQIIHALHNLNELIQTDRQSIPPAMLDDQLPKEVEEKKTKYISSSAELFKESKQDLAMLQLNVKDLTHELKDGEGWWAELVDLCVNQKLDDRLLDRVISAICDSHHGDHNFAQFRDTNGLKLVLNRLLTDLQDSRKNVTKELSKLLHIETPSDRLLLSAQMCHLRPDQRSNDRCEICAIEDLLDLYEGCLYIFKRENPRGGRAEEDADVGLVRLTSQLEKILKALGVFASSRIKSVEGEFRQDWEHLVKFSATQSKLIDKWKAEFTSMRAAWTALNSFVAAYDEVAMAVERIQVKPAREVELLRKKKAEEERKKRNAVGGESSSSLNALMINHIITMGEVEQTKMRFHCEKVGAEHKLEVKLGQLAYLRNLKGIQKDTAETNGENQDECPICRSALGTSWMVLGCGHCFCANCLDELQKRIPADSLGRLYVKCPVCRVNTRQGNISHVFTESGKNVYWGHQEETLVGSYSTKVESIVRCLKEIHRKEPQAKSLVFSNWTEVLQILEKALLENSIPYAMLGKSGKFKQNLKLFKTSDTINTMLMSFSQGGKGLNLIEATHVLLVEPLLSKGAELQAIGRVHRIGQTKPTKIHRFLMRRSVEEKIVGVFGSLTTGSSCSEIGSLAETNLTVGELRGLFD